MHIRCILKSSSEDWRYDVHKVEFRSALEARVFVKGPSHDLISQPGCIPCKTYAEGTPIPKLSYARYFQGKRAVKNLSTDDFKKLRVLAQILTFS